MPPVITLLSAAVPPEQIVMPAPPTATVGSAATVSVAVGRETQPLDVCVKVKVAVPAPTAVMAPALVMVAIAVLLDVQVPPVVGVILAVPPTHRLVALSVPMVGRGVIDSVMELLACGQPELLLVL